MKHSVLTGQYRNDPPTQEGEMSTSNWLLCTWGEEQEGLCTGPGIPITQDICFSIWGSGKKNQHKNNLSATTTTSFSTNITSSLKSSPQGQIHLEDDTCD